MLWGIYFKKFFDIEVLVDCMSTIAKAQVDPRIYRNWFLLNRRCTISVVTGAGLSDEGEAGETVAQGSGGAALVSQLKVDRGINEYFKGSGDEECYGAVRLQPLSWQDDVVGLNGEIRLVQAALNRLNHFVEESQLEIHPDQSKSSYMVFGSKSYKKEVVKETEEDPLRVGDVKLERSKSMTYLASWGRCCTRTAWPPAPTPRWSFGPPK